MGKRIFITVLCLISLIFGTGFTTGTTQSDSVARGTPLPILMYHAVCAGKCERYVIPPEELERDFRFLNENGYQSVTVTDLILFQQQGIPLPEKPVMLTFDDGSRTNYLHVFPLLKKYNLRAVMAVVGTYTESNYNQNGEPLKNAYAYLTYEQIKEMQESGLVEIQNHSYNLHSVGSRNGLKPKRNESPEEYEQILSNDLLKLEDRLQERVGVRCQAVVYPFGAFDKKLTVPVLQKLGYRAAFTCTEGMNYINRRTNLFYLKRYNRPYNKTAKTILEKAAPQKNNILRQPMSLF